MPKGEGSIVVVSKAYTDRLNSISTFDPEWQVGDNMYLLVDGFNLDDGYLAELKWKQQKSDRSIPIKVHIPKSEILAIYTFIGSKEAIMGFVQKKAGSK
jgi:hypothetical protein